VNDDPHREQPGVKPDRTKEDERRFREAGLDKTLADSFPASDPPSTLPNPEDDDAREPHPRTPAGTRHKAAPER
jgi:hypothetical protein